jgi:hypothetical protein
MFNPTCLCVPLDPPPPPTRRLEGMWLQLAGQQVALPLLPPRFERNPGPVGGGGSGREGGGGRADGRYDLSANACIQTRGADTCTHPFIETSR